MSFNHKALQDLVNKPQGNVARHVRQRAEKLTEDMRDITFGMQKKGSGNPIPRPKFNEIIQNQPAARAATSVEIGIPIDQQDSRKGHEGGGFGKWLAEKVEKRDAKGDNWITKAFKRNRHFKVAR